MTLDPTPAEPDSSHPLADGRERRLDPRWVTVSRLGAAISSIVLLGATGIGVGAVLFAGVEAAPWIAAAWGLLALLMAVRALWWPKVRWRHISWRLDRRGLTIRRGVVWRSITSVPRSRVQHTDVSQGPVQQRLGLATLILHTAGTQHAAVPLGGLSREDALAVRDYLIDRVSGDGV